MSATLEGWCAIVLGGTGGLGRATAFALAERGADVLIAARHAEQVAAVAAELNDEVRAGSVAGAAADVRDASQVEALAEFALERHGRIDALIGCAGIDVRGASQRAVPPPVVSLTLDEWRTVVDTNLRGGYLAARAVVPAMARRRRGEIVMVSSWPAGMTGQPMAAAYCASKFGLGAMCEALADEVRGAGIRVQVVAPGLIDTALVRHSTLARRVGPPLTPEAVADHILRLITLPDDVTWSPPRRHGVPLLRSATSC